MLSYLKMSQRQCISTKMPPHQSATLGNSCTTDSDCAPGLGEKCSGADPGDSHGAGGNKNMPAFCQKNQEFSIDQQNECLCQLANSNFLCSAPPGHQGNVTFMETCCLPESDRARAQNFSGQCSIAQVRGESAPSDMEILSQSGVHCSQHVGPPKEHEHEHEHECATGNKWCPSLNKCINSSQECTKEPSHGPSVDTGIGQVARALQKHGLDINCKGSVRSVLMKVLSNTRVADGETSFSTLFCAFASKPIDKARWSDKSDWQKLVEFLGKRSLQTKDPIADVDSGCKPGTYYSVKDGNAYDLTRLISMFLDYTEIDTLISDDRDGKLPIPSTQDYKAAENALLGDGNFSPIHAKVFKHAILATTISLLYPCGAKDASSGNQAAKALTSAFADQAVDAHSSPGPKAAKTSPHKDKGAKFNWMLFWIILGSVVVVVLVVIGFLVIRHDRKRVEIDAPATTSATKE